MATFDLDGHGALLVAQGIELDGLNLTTAVDAVALVDEYERRRRRPLGKPSS